MRRGWKNCYIWYIIQTSMNVEIIQIFTHVISSFFLEVTQNFLLSGFQRFVKISNWRRKGQAWTQTLSLFSKSMASTTKYANYDSVLDNIISTVRRSYFGKTVNNKFLKDLKFLMKNKMKPRLMKPAQWNLFWTLNLTVCHCQTKSLSKSLDTSIFRK